MLYEIAFTLWPATNFTKTLKDLLCDVLKLFILSFYAHGIQLKKTQSHLYCDFTFTFPRLCSLHILHLETTSASYLTYDSVQFVSLHILF